MLEFPFWTEWGVLSKGFYGGRWGYIIPTVGRGDEPKSTGDDECELVVSTCTVYRWKKGTPTIVQYWLILWEKRKCNQDM